MMLWSSSSPLSSSSSSWVCLCLLMMGPLLVSAAPGGSRAVKPSVPLKQSLDGPFQLVRPDSSHTNLEIIPEGVELLKSISQKVVVISSLGAFHTGKSFLLNQIMDEQKGFALGPTVSPETKGIWARVAFKGDDAIIYLDTEGFFGQGASEAYDAKIFAVATLLSSKLLFNSVKTIDQSAMDYLELLARRALMFSLKASVKEQRHSYLSFPSLTWVVRDFISDIPEAYNGSPNSWITDLLHVRKREPVHIYSEDEEGMTNQELSKIFTSVECHPLSFPLAHPEKLRHLDEIPLKDLEPRFLREVKALKENIFTNLQRKKFDDKELNGFGLSELLQTLVDLANTGIFPKVPGVWEGFIRIESQTALGDCTEQFRRNLQEQINASTPVPESSLHDIFAHEQLSALALLKAMLLGLTEVQNKVSVQLKDEVGKLRQRFEEENQRNIQSFCATHREAQEQALDALAAEFVLPIVPAELKDSIRKLSNEAQTYAHSPNCTPSAAALAKHIDRLQATTIASNLAALRKACTDSKVAHIQAFSQHISTLSFPLAPSFVKAECDKWVERGLKGFEEQMGGFKDTDAYREIGKELEQVLVGKRDSTILANNNAIEEKILLLVRDIIKEKLRKYSDTTTKTSTQMGSSVDKLTKEAISHFDKNATYAKESNSFSAWKLQFTTELKKATDTLVEENKKRTQKLFSSQSEAILTTLRMRLRGVMIPLEDKEIEEEIETHTSTAKKEREEKLREYQSVDPEAYQMSLLEFNADLNKQATKLRKDNVNELLQLCKIPLERSEQRIYQVYLSSWLEFMFERDAQRILKEELGEKIKSPRLLDQAVKTYIEDNLATKFPFSSALTYLKFGVASAAVVLSIAFCGSKRY